MCGFVGWVFLLILLMVGLVEVSGCCLVWCVVGDDWLLVVE